MKLPHSFTTVNDFLHATVLSCVLALTAIGASDELFSSPGDTALAAVARAASVASIAIGTPFVEAQYKTVVQ